MSSSSLLMLLGVLILTSGFFSGSETSLMSLNRYRLKHLIRNNNRAAKRVHTMLERPDRLLGVILLGNTFTNVIASSVATMWTMQESSRLGPVGVAFILTLLILIFAEMTPKTMAALYPERFAFPVSLPLMLLQKLFYPLVWLLNLVSNGLLRMFGIVVGTSSLEPISREELRTIVLETRGMISSSHQDMLLRILDLEMVTVDDVMVPKSEIVALDLDATPEEIKEAISSCSYTWLPLYRGQLDHVYGILKVKRGLHAIALGAYDHEDLLKIAEPVYFVPENTPLSVQLNHFRYEKREFGFVVDEYGDIQGIITLEDAIEEIVGEFSGTLEMEGEDVMSHQDDTVIVDGRMNVRELNRETGWQLSELGPKTLSGLIVEHLEMMPKEGIGLRLNGLPMEILSVAGHRVSQVKAYPELQEIEAADDELDEPT